MLLGFGVEAQTLVDSKLEQFARKELLEGISIFGDDVNQVGIVIMEVNSGNVIANISIGQYHGVVKDIPEGNNDAIPAGISRAVLYLSIVDILGPDFIVETGKGLYVDSISGCTITDMRYNHGGYGALTLKKAFDVSDVGIINAVETAFNKNMGQYGPALRKTGILFEDYDDETTSYQETSSWRPWVPCDIIGYSSPFSLYQQTAWVNMVATRGKLVFRLNKDDPTTPICEVKNKAGFDSLASAMFETVEHGTGLKMRSNYVHVAGLTNVSPADGLDCRGCFSAAFFPYENPQYTIGVFVNKHDLPAGRKIPSEIAGKIIDYMVENFLHLKDNREKDEAFAAPSIPPKYHPSEK